MAKNFIYTKDKRIPVYIDSEGQETVHTGGNVTLISSSGAELTSLVTTGGDSSSYSTMSGIITATPTVGAKTITLSGHPFTLTDGMVAYGSIKKIDSSGTVTTLDTAAITVAGDVITLPNIDDFVAGDTIDLTLSATYKAYDTSLDIIKSIEQTPIYARYTSVENIVTASDIGASDGVWKDQGSEIDCRGYKTIGVYINFTVNNSTGNQIQILSKHTSGGSDEYTHENTIDYQKTLGDSSIKVLYKFNIETIPFIQIQSKATDIDTGGGTEGTVTIDIIKEY